jgi:hypothetical protein
MAEDDRRPFAHLGDMELDAVGVDGVVLHDVVRSQSSVASSD